ncbi:MAG: cation transporter [Phaeospirillum sp.]|nr:cation transporter [Phaeospirillum sp.]
MNTIEGLWRFARQARIAHHIPGRVRLKLEGKADGAAADVRHFVDAASRTSGIRSVNVNLLARSCVVEYDTALISPSAWQDIVDGTRSPHAEQLLRSLAHA